MLALLSCVSNCASRATLAAGAGRAASAAVPAITTAGVEAEWTFNSAAAIAAISTLAAGSTQPTLAGRHLLNEILCDGDRRGNVPQAQCDSPAADAAGPARPTGSAIATIAAVAEEAEFGVPVAAIAAVAAAAPVAAAASAAAVHVSNEVR